MGHGIGHGSSTFMTTPRLLIILCCLPFILKNPIKLNPFPKYFLLKVKDLNFFMAWVTSSGYRWVTDEVTESVTDDLSRSCDSENNCKGSF